MIKATEHALSCTVTTFLEPKDVFFFQFLSRKKKRISSLREAIMHVPSGNYIVVLSNDYFNYV